MIFERGIGVKEEIGIGMNVVSDLKRIEEFYNEHKSGYYLMDQKGTYILYSREDEDPFEFFLSNKFGEWDLNNAEQWREYIITYVSENEAEENYTW